MVNRWRIPESEGRNLFEQILHNRQLQAEDLRGGLESLPDEALLANIEQVALRITKALRNNEPMVIFGHDDPDGITSTYILYQYLNSCGYQRHHYYIPNRNLEPHGIQQSLIDFVKNGGYTLVVTVDNGISAAWGVNELNKVGAEVLITDHHLIQPDSLPEALAILNPQLPDCMYPFKYLAGVGVVLMLIRYLSKILDHPVSPAAYFWAAVGSLADKVPMIGVNHLIVRHVIDNWKTIPDYTIDFLLRNYNRISGPGGIFSFIQYTSRLIANGREADGQHTALSFMLQVSDEKAVLFQDLEQQKNRWEHELNRVFGIMDNLLTGFVGNAFVYFDDEDVIPYSLLGTAATYVVNNLGVPTIMLKLHNGYTVCEGRCSDGFNMVSAFTHCKDHLKQYGGHPKAAGFTMEPYKYDEFLDCFNDYLLASLETAPEPGKIPVDAVISLSDLDSDNWHQIELLLPWGMQNPEPVLALKNVSLAELQSRVTLDNNSLSISDHKRYDLIISWKNSGLIRILDFYES